MGSKDDFLKKEIKKLLTEWHIGTEDMFDEEDLEAMTADIMEIIKNQKNNTKTFKKSLKLIYSV